MSLYGWDILLLVLVLISLPLLWSEFRNQADKAQAKIFLIYLALFAWSAFSTWWATDTVLVSAWCFRLLEGGLLLLLVRALKPKFAWVCASLAAAGSIQALWAIGQFLTQGTFANKWLGVAVHPLAQAGTSVVLASGGRWLRAYAGQVHPNVLGALLVITSLATAWLVVNVKFKNQNVKLLLWLVYLVQLAGLFFSFSRGAWLALFITFVFWWWRARDERRTVAAATVAALACFAALGLVYWQPTTGRILGGSRLEQESVVDRRVELQQSSALLQRAWFAGVGFGNYTAALYQANPTWPSYRYQPVSDLYLLILTELGVVGLGLWLWLVWRSLVLGWQTNMPYLLLPVLVTGLFDHYWWTIPSMALLFWLVIALSGVRSDSD